MFICVNLLFRNVNHIGLTNKSQYSTALNIASRVLQMLVDIAEINARYKAPQSDNKTYKM